MINKEFHLSVDDVFKSLIFVSDNKIPLKKYFFFRELYQLWKKYKIKTGLHLFYEQKIKGKVRNLCEVRNLKNELKENWLYFNVHALNPHTPPYKQSITKQKKTFDKIFNEIRRFAGKEYLTNYVRLHHYSESFELSKYLKKKKIKALFSTDRNVGSHRLPKKNSRELIIFGKTLYKGLKFIRTDFRVEWIKNYKRKEILNRFIKCYKNKNRLIIYSHEYNFKRKKFRAALKKIISILYKDLKARAVKP